MTHLAKRIITAAAFSFYAVTAAGQTSYLISTFAGGLPGPTSMPGTSYAIQPPNGVATDRFGNTYVSTSSNCVFRLDANGNLLRIAGTGEPGYSGDGGNALNAQMNNPQGLAVDFAGNVYIADQNNQRVRKVSPLGIITTVAGTGTPGYSGDNGPATNAQLFSPTGLAVDGSGNLYIADESNNLIRKVTNGQISTVAGTLQQGTSGDGGPATSATLNSPVALAWDGAGYLYVGDSADLVRKINVATGVISHVAGVANFPIDTGDGGSAGSASLNPVGLAVDLAGNLYIADEINQVVRKVNTSGIINVFAGGGGNLGDGGSAVNAQIFNPAGVAVDYRGNVYILDHANRVRVVNTGNIINTAIGTGGWPNSGDGNAASLAQLAGTWGLTIDSANNLYIADTNNNRVRKIPLSGAQAGVISTFAGNGANANSGDGNQATNAAITVNAVAAFNGSLYLGSTAVVRQVAPNGTISTVAGTGIPGYNGDNMPATSAQLSNYITGLAVDNNGNLYISDSANNRVRRVTPQGTITTVAGTASGGYNGDNQAGTAAELSLPQALALDASSSNLYIADYNNCRVRKLVLATNAISTVAGNGTCTDTGDGLTATNATVAYPTGLAVDAAGNVFIATGGNKVREVSGGIISTIAGTGTAGFSGDGGPATSARLNATLAVAVDSAGNLYVSDFKNNAVRVLQPAGVNPLLTVSSTHSGGFFAGQPNATFDISVTNWPLAGSTSGAATVTDIVPAGLNPVSMGGNGWTCVYTAPSYSCQHNGSLTPGTTDNALVLVASVATQAPQVTNQVTVSGGGALGTGSSDPAFVGSATPVLEISTSHTKNFAAGESDATFMINVANQDWAQAVNGAVTVVDTIPTGLTLVSLAGNGWTCTGASCTSTATSMVGGAGYNPIIGTVNVTASAPSNLTNSATASGGGSANATATDTIRVVASCNISGGASASVTDVQTMINEALGVNFSVNDLNSDGVVNVIDVRIVMNAIFDSNCVV